MPVLRSDVDLVVNVASGQTIRKAVTRDVTAEAVTFDLASKISAALNTNATFVGIANPNAGQIAAQVRALTRQNSALIRLLAGLVLADQAALLDNTGT